MQRQTNKQTKIKNTCIKSKTIIVGSVKCGKGWPLGRKRPTDVRTLHAEYKNIGRGKSNKVTKSQEKNQENLLYSNCGHPE